MAPPDQATIENCSATALVMTIISNCHASSCLLVGVAVRGLHSARSNSESFEFVHQLTIDGDPCTSDNVVAILLRGGRVWAIEASVKFDAASLLISEQIV